MRPFVRKFSRLGTWYWISFLELVRLPKCVCSSQSTASQIDAKRKAHVFQRWCRSFSRFCVAGDKCEIQHQVMWRGWEDFRGLSNGCVGGVWSRPEKCVGRLQRCNRHPGVLASYLVICFQNIILKWNCSETAKQIPVHCGRKIGFLA